MRTLFLASAAFAATLATQSFADESATIPLRLDVASNATAAPSDDPVLSGGGSNDSGAGAVGDYFDNWFARVAQAQDSQPHWMTPLATVTPRLEEEVRYDQFWERAGNGSSIDMYGSGKGLELIPTTTNEVLINVPSYEDRYFKKPAQGWGDWPFLTVKQRLLSSPEDQGNYILTAFLGVQAPSGNAAYTNHAWLITPTIAGGMGWGDFDVQATTGVAIPLRETSVIGYAVATNVALQYHFSQFFWPELEFNNTIWSGGQRDGKDQLFLTPGLILGRFQLFQGARFIIGAGYQFAVSPVKTTEPVLTPTYDHSWLLSVRVAF
jgi:hypothetical protein